MSMPSVRSFLPVQFACIFLLFALSGCDTPPDKDEQLKKEKKAREEAEQSKSNWQVAFFVLAGIGVVAFFVRKANQQHPSRPPTPFRPTLHPIVNRFGITESPPQSKPTTRPLRDAASTDGNLRHVSAQPISGTYIIDGLNVCRSYHQDQVFRVQTLLTLCIQLREAGATFLCIFDANARHIARETGWPIQSEVCEKLISEYDNCFSAVPGGIQADDFVLLRADSEGCKVISNDRFSKPEDDYLNRYPWITDPHRLIKGSVMANRLLVPALGIDVSVVREKTNDIYAATKRLYELTREHKKA